MSSETKPKKGKMGVGSVVWVKDPAIAGTDLFTKGSILAIDEKGKATVETTNGVKTQELVLKIDAKEDKTEAPSNRARRACYDLIANPRFDEIVMLCICLNTFVMATEHFGQPDSWYGFCHAMNYVFAVFFTLEMAVKLTALGGQYFADSWNVFDCTIVLLTWIGIVVSALVGTSLGSVATVIRTFRVGRVFRLIEGASSVRRLINTLMTTLPVFGNIFMVLAQFFLNFWN